MIAGDIVTYDVGFGPVNIGGFVYTFEEHTPPTQPLEGVDSESMASKYSSPPVLHAKYWLGKAPHATGHSSGWFNRQYKRVYESVIELTKGWIFTESAVRGVYVHTKEKMFVLSKLLVEKAW